MHITNSDLELLIHLENKLGAQENWSDDVLALWGLVDRLVRQRDEGRVRTRTAIANRRKTDKNYARSKKNA